MANSCKPFSIIFLSCFLNIFLIESSTDGNRGITMDLIHRDSPKSPFYDPSINSYEHVKRAVHRSYDRYSIMKASIMNISLDAFTSPVTSSSSVGSYLMKVKIGTPPVDVVAIADTGSDLSWTQCAPCKCFKQNNPLLDTRKSSTYKTIPCKSDECEKYSNGLTVCGTDNAVCPYTVTYGDNSYTQGELATETFTFDLSTGGTKAFPGVVFGCGRSNAGTFSADSSGIVGLGGGAVSIVRQLDDSVAGRFAYCLTPPRSNSTSTISFGADAVVAGALTTPILSSAGQATFYFLSLKAISVGDRTVEINPKIKAGSGLQQSGGGNIIIDSGTTLTFLPSDLFDGFSSALESAVQGGHKVTDPTGSGLSPCFKVSGGGELKVPAITAKFDGADVVIRGSVFLDVADGVQCSTFVGATGLAIFGNLHQVNYRIGYDLNGKKLSFQAADCSQRS